MKNRNFRTLKGLRQRQAGYTLVELSITVSIIALLIVGSITGVQGLLLANKANRTLSQTTVATANISRLSSATGAKDLTTTALTNLGAWDSSAIKRVTTQGPTPAGGTAPAPVTTVTVNNPFGGIIQVAPNEVIPGVFAASTGYIYRIAGVPESVCASLATSFYTTAPGIWINTSTAADGKVGAIGPEGNAYRFPGKIDSLGNLQTRCAAGTGENGLVEIALFIPA
jgi:prepilin-type N-terminal cleavage/methylation domain-containing protein